MLMDTTDSPLSLLPMVKESLTSQVPEECGLLSNWQNLNLTTSLSSQMRTLRELTNVC